MTRVLIAAPTPTMRAGLRALLTTSDVEVVGETSSLHGLAPLPPEVDVVVIADEALLAELSTVLEEAPHLAVVALTDEADVEQVLRSSLLVGWAVLPLDASAPELAAAVAAADQGLIALPPSVLDRLLRRSSHAEAIAELRAEPLTAREREVLELLGRGLSNKLIARQLSISEHTVKYHVSSIFAKLGATSRTDAIARGARRGLISL